MSFSGDGSDDTYARVESAIVSAVPFTVAGWMLHTGVHNTETAFGIVDVSATDHFFTIQAGIGGGNDQVRCRAADGTASSATASNTYSDDVWNHVAAIFTSVTDRRMIVNGDWGNSGTSTTSRTPANLDRTTIGKLDYSSGSGTQGWTGNLADWSIWDAALIQGEVEALAAGAAAARIRPVSLIRHWTFYNVADVTDRRAGEAVTMGTAVGTADHHGKIYRSAPQMAIGIPPQGAPPAANTRRYTLATLGVG